MLPTNPPETGGAGVPTGSAPAPAPATKKSLLKNPWFYAVVAVVIVAAIVLHAHRGFV